MDHQRLEEKLEQMAKLARTQLADQKRDMQSEARDSIFRAAVCGMILGLVLGSWLF